MFKPVDPRVNFPRLEEGILAFWQQNAIFRRSVEERPEDRLFVFYEGPPTANARPGIHHVLSRVFKDLIPRYKTMQGYRVPRKGGWDTHGLPVELEIEKELGLKSKPEIEQYGIAAFNAKCKESVSRYVEEWTRLSERIAYWADYDNPYVTWHNDYIESGWWLLKQMWGHGLVYEDYRVSPYCPRCGTTLSDHEVSLGYQDDTPDPSVFPKFRVAAADFEAATGVATGGFEWVSLVAWTTTPWTLPGNTALAVNPAAEYGLFEYKRDDGQWELVVVAVSLLSNALPGKTSIDVDVNPESLVGRKSLPAEGAALCLGRFSGTRLVDLRYEPLYRPEDLREWGAFTQVIQHLQVGDKTFADRAGTEISGSGVRANRMLMGGPGDPGRFPRRVVAADFVSLEDGTGIVHVAPAFGAEDFELGRREGLLFVQPIDLRGIMAPGLPGEGKFAKEADRDIIRDLDGRGLMLKHGTIKHTYPFCWRCGTPLLYYAKPSWYIRTTAQKASLLEGNSRINWYPDHIRDGRFGNWLENNIDWAVSRERYWGSPLPIWRCSSCGSTSCIGSRDDLVDRAVDRAMAEALEDLHRPFIDDILLRCDQSGCDGEARRVPEVADAWYDSGAMPYAQWHYPFEHEEEFLRNFPADYICEAIDQTRGWFYTLHAEATLLKASEAVPESIAFRNVICLGHINDEKGNKMSKSRGNTVSPWDVLDAHGADATRWYMYTASPAGSSRRFSLGLVEEGLRRFLLTLWNTYSFFVSYANIDQADPRVAPATAAPELDRWLLSELNALVLKVTEELEAYDPTDAARAIEAFVDDLSNWYVRRSRRRFWRGASEADTDKQWAYHTLYTALVTVSKLLAPFTPFIAEEMYRNLVVSLDPAAPESVHLAAWPTADNARTDQHLNEHIRSVKRVCSLGRAARAKAQIKVRQPVSQVLVKLPTASNPGSAEVAVISRYRDLIKEELNAYDVEFLVDESEIVHFDVKPNLPALGRKFGAGLAVIRQGLAAMPPAAVADVVRRGESLSVEGYALDPQDILLEPHDEPGYATASDAGYTVAITTTITPELAEEGLAREIVRRLQDMRREAGFDLADRITTWYEAAPEVARVIHSQAAYIQGETLTTELVAGVPPAGTHSARHDLDGASVALSIRRNG